ncbi:FxsA family protein [Shewanella sp. SNU WT4]|uniref:FxsA family protein n=1 Tax=Shewanella sp. SNU WT4 TaxID=2590015 RepID=UPI00112C572D|nr:FxsA family protein [Shewanella sp. SNU WT4]QDF68252.1 FxsA family protein [Shewanella sp. SNU WT4]
MRLPWLLLLIALPMAELAVLIQVGEEVGSLNTVALVILTAIIGVSLVKRQGLATLMQAQEKMARGEAPTEEIVGGMMLVMAGILLLIPGFVTDAFGVLLLLPWTRHAFARLASTRMQTQFSQQFSSSQFGSSQFGSGQFHQGFDQPSANGDIFEGEFERKDDSRPRLVLDQEPRSPSSDK